MKTLIKRINEIQLLREETKTGVQGIMKTWKFNEFLADQNSLNDEIGTLINDTIAMAGEAAKAGKASGKRLLEVMNIKPHEERVNLKEIATNTLNSAVEEIRREAAIFISRIGGEAEKMSGKGVSPEVILELIERDWELQSSGRLCGALWRTLERIISGLATQIYSLAELAVRCGQELEIGLG